MVFTMIHVLVVDDEIHCVEGVLYAIDWRCMGVEQVFTAYSMGQAQELFQKEEVHIVICDVEMPKGSGFDLLAWIRNSGYTPVIIMLTSYATFKYAKQAIEFNCLDYLLKPAAPEALADVVRRAVVQVEKIRREHENDLLARYWNENEKKRFRHFWREIIEQFTYLDSASIMERARSEHIVFEAGNLYLPVLFKVHENTVGTGFSLTETVLKQLCPEGFEQNRSTVLVYGKQMVLAISGCPDSFELHHRRMVSHSRRFINEGLEKFTVSISAYIGEFEEPGAVAVQYEQLQKMDKNNVAQKSGIYYLSQWKDGTAVYKRPDMELWMKDFSDGRYERMIGQVEKYLNRLVNEGNVNQNILTQFTQDFLQAFYIAVGEKEIQAHLLFVDDLSVQLSQNASISVGDFICWIRHMADKAGNYVAMVSDTDCVVRKIKKYIKANLGEELSRGQLSAVVCMSPDYLSRVFYQETGIHLSEYIKEQRMQEAIHLLETTNMPVGDVGFKVGYSNFAYFSQVFRIRCKATPAEYRMKMRKQN